MYLGALCAGGPQLPLIVVLILCNDVNSWGRSTNPSSQPSDAYKHMFHDSTIHHFFLPVVRIDYGSRLAGEKLFYFDAWGMFMNVGCTFAGLNHTHLILKSIIFISGHERNFRNAAGKWLSFRSYMSWAWLLTVVCFISCTKKKNAACTGNEQNCAIHDGVVTFRQVLRLLLCTS